MCRNFLFHFEKLRLQHSKLGKVKKLRKKLKMVITLEKRFFSANTEYRLHQWWSRYCDKACWSINYEPTAAAQFAFRYSRALSACAVVAEGAATLVLPTTASPAAGVIFGNENTPKKLP